MTRGAQAFITPLTLQAVSGQPVRTELFDTEAEAGMGHIELARWADAVLVAPASANFLARLTYGLADDLLTTLCLATEAPLLVAPAMNRVMWDSPATQANLVTLQQRGITLLGPAEGAQACGETGAGRLLEPAELITGLGELFNSGELAGLTVVVTAGPTREKLDPVRYISNRSSGCMGYATACAARDAGARVILVSGPVNLDAPAGIEIVRVQSAADMQQAVDTHIATADIFIATAAVADYRAARPAEQKMKKQADGLVLSLERTPDILASVAARTPPPFCVGFAAETENVAAYAQAKLAAKCLDMIAANEVGEALGFDSDDNALVLYWPDNSAGTQSLALERASKVRLARELITHIARRYYAKHTDTNHSGQDSQSATRP